MNKDHLQERIDGEFRVSKYAKLTLWTLGILGTTAFGSLLIYDTRWPVWAYLVIPGLYFLITQGWFRSEFLRKEQVAQAYLALWRTDQLADALGHFYHNNRFQKRPGDEEEKQQFYRLDEATGEYVPIP